MEGVGVLEEGLVVEGVGVGVFEPDVAALEEGLGVVEVLGAEEVDAGGYVIALPPAPVLLPPLSSVPFPFPLPSLQSPSPTAPSPPPPPFPPPLILLS